MVIRYRPLGAAMALAFSGVLPALAETQVLDTVVVKANRETPLPAAAGSLDAGAVAARRAFVSDTAQLLDDVPGMSFYGSGGVSSLPVIRGLNDDRIGIRIDGMDLTSACGNHMNPPLSYIAPANVARATVVAGITPVSLGGDSIAGSIIIDSKTPAFAKAGEAPLYGGSISAYYRSNGHASGGSVAAQAATENLAISYTGSIATSDNYKSGSGTEVKSSEYEAQNHAISLAAQGDGNLLVANLGYQHIPYQGFPNARMDMVNNDAFFANLRYEGQFDWGKLEARAYYQHTEHEMNFLATKRYMGPGMQSADMPMNTDGKNLGFVLKGDIMLSERDTLRVGTEFHGFRLDDWWPPTSMTGMAAMMMGPGTFQNINDGKRDRAGLFAEWEARWDSQWSTLLGARYEHVKMDTGTVQPYSSTSMMQMADQRAARAFNAEDRERNDNNVDLTALLRFTPDANSTYEGGYARKTRSPNLYERYTWAPGAMAMSMNGWFGDGNGYVGDIDLKPEVAHTISATASWHDAAKREWNFAVTPYLTYVDNYIDVLRCPTSLGGACTAANQTVANNFVYLQFANQDARLYGVDLSGRLPLGSSAFGSFTGRGVVGYVRGTNRDTGDNLYHMMPLNAKLALDHRLEQWSNSLEFQLVAAKNDVQAVRNELETAGYALLNLRTAYEWKHVRLDAGIENLLDKNYDLPLGGAYLGERPFAWGSNVAGMGRSAYVGMTLKF